MKLFSFGKKIKKITHEKAPKAKKATQKRKKYKNHIKRLHIAPVVEDNIITTLHNYIDANTQPYIGAVNVGSTDIVMLLCLNNELIERDGIANDLGDIKVATNLANSDGDISGNLYNASFEEDLDSKTNPQIVFLPTLNTLETLDTILPNDGKLGIVTLPADLSITNLDEYLDNGQINAPLAPFDENDTSDMATVTVAEFKKLMNEYLNNSEPNKDINKDGLSNDLDNSTITNNDASTDNDASNSDDLPSSSEDNSSDKDNDLPGLDDDLPSLDDDANSLDDLPSLDEDNSSDKDSDLPSLDNDSPSLDDDNSSDESSSSSEDNSSDKDSDLPSLDDDLPSLDDDNSSDEASSSSEDSSSDKDNDLPGLDDDLPSLDDDSSLDDLPSLDDNNASDESSSSSKDNSSDKDNDLPSLDDDSSLDDLPSLDDDNSSDKDSDLPGLDDSSLDDLSNLDDNNASDKSSSSNEDNASDKGNKSESNGSLADNDDSLNDSSELTSLDNDDPAQSRQDTKSEQVAPANNSSSIQTISTDEPNINQINIDDVKPTYADTFSNQIDTVLASIQTPQFTITNEDLQSEDIARKKQIYNDNLRIETEQLKAGIKAKLLNQINTALSPLIDVSQFKQSFPKIESILHDKFLNDSELEAAIAKLNREIQQRYQQTYDNMRKEALAQVDKQWNAEYAPKQDKELRDTRTHIKVTAQHSYDNAIEMFLANERIELQPLIDKQVTQILSNIDPDITNANDTLKQVVGQYRVDILTSIKMKEYANKPIAVTPVNDSLKHEIASLRDQIAHLKQKQTTVKSKPEQVLNQTLESASPVDKNDKTYSLNDNIDLKDNATVSKMNHNHMPDLNDELSF